MKRLNIYNLLQRNVLCVLMRTSRCLEGARHWCPLCALQKPSEETDSIAACLDYF